MTIRLQTGSHWREACEADRYMRSLSFFSAVASIFLGAFTTTGCNGATSKSGEVAYRQPTMGTYVGSGPRPLMKLELNQNGTYFAEDITPPGFITMIEGNTPYRDPLHCNQTGEWTWNARTGDLTLTPKSQNGNQWGTQHLRADKSNPECLIWGGGFLQRQEPTNAIPHI